MALSFNEPHAIDALGWHEVDRAELGWGIFDKNLSVRSHARRFDKTVVVGRFWMKDNFGNAEGMVKTRQQARASLPPAPQMQALPG